MSHFSQRAFLDSCAKAFPELFRDVAVIEVGSGDINGSARTMFSSAAYVGVDVAPGPGVDLVGGGQDVQLGSGRFDVAVSCECFEHNPYWRETLGNMIAHLKPNGLFIVTCATLGRPEHGTPRSSPSFSLSVQVDWNYYRNVSETELAAALRGLPRDTSFRTFRRRTEADLYLIGFADGVPEGLSARFKAFSPQWGTDKSAPMRLFLVVSGLLEGYLRVSPYAIARSLRVMQSAYTAAKSVLR